VKTLHGSYSGHSTVNTGKVKVMTVIGVTTVVEVQCLVVVVVNGVMLKFQRLCFTVSNGEKQASCHHSHCLYVVRLYVLLSLMGRNKRHVIILIVCTSFVCMFYCLTYRQ
jgi:hypothetical protein